MSDRSRPNARPKKTGLPGFSDRLTKLLQGQVWVENGELIHWTHQSLAACTESVGFPVRAATISVLRNNTTADPTGQQLMGLSLAFAISPLCWFDEKEFLDTFRSVIQASDRARNQAQVY